MNKLDINESSVVEGQYTNHPSPITHTQIGTQIGTQYTVIITQFGTFFALDGVNIYCIKINERREEDSSTDKTKKCKMVVSNGHFTFLQTKLFYGN